MKWRHLTFWKEFKVALLSVAIKLALKTCSSILSTTRCSHKPRATGNLGESQAGCRAWVEPQKAFYPVSLCHPCWEADLPPLPRTPSPSVSKSDQRQQSVNSHSIPSVREPCERLSWQGKGGQRVPGCLLSGQIPSISPEKKTLKGGCLRQYILPPKVVHAHSATNSFPLNKFGEYCMLLILRGSRSHWHVKGSEKETCLCFMKDFPNAVPCYTT